MNCKCDSWCRAEPQPITDEHHMNCDHYNDSIRVVRITHAGNSYYDADIVGALQTLAEGDDYKYEVEILQMLKRDYDTLPEFTGF